MQLILLAPLFASLADGFFASRYIGEMAMDAISGVLPFVVFVMLVLNTFGMGPTVLAGKALGNGNRKKANQYWTLSLCSITILSLALIAFAAIFGENFISSTSINEEERQQVTEYFYPIIIYLVINAFASSCNSYIIADGYPKIVSFTTTLANVVNISLDIFFMGYLDIGVKGAAYASICCALTNLVIVIPLINKKTFPFHLTKPSMEFIGLLKDGLSMWAALNAGGICFSGYESLCNMLIAKNASVAEVGVWGISIYVLNLGFTVCGSFNYAYQYINSLLAGMEDYNGMKVVARKYWWTSFTTGCVMCAAIYILHEPMMPFFGIESYQGTYIQNLPLYVTLLYIMVIASLYPYAEIALSHGHSAYKIGLYCSLLVGCPLIMRLIVSVSGPDYIWYSLPLIGLMQTIFMLCLIQYNRKSNPLVTPYLFSQKVPEYVSMETSCSFDKNGVSSLLEQVRTFISIDEVNETLAKDIELCCEEIIYNTISVPGRKGDYFDMRLVSLPGAMKLVMMHLGKPFSPVLSPQKLSSLASNPESVSEMDLRLEIVNRVCQDISYRYAYGINIVELRFLL